MLKIIIDIEHDLAPVLENVLKHNHRRLNEINIRRELVSTFKSGIYRILYLDYMDAGNYWSILPWHTYQKLEYLIWNALVMNRLKRDIEAISIQIKYTSIEVNLFVPS